jgi:hypothetical protein
MSRSYTSSHSGATWRVVGQLHTHKRQINIHKSWAQENMQRALEEIINRFAVQKTAGNHRSAEAQIRKNGCSRVDAKEEVQERIKC